MAFTQALNPAVPANGDQVSQGAQRIRELTRDVKERLASLTVNPDADPLVLKAGVIPVGYALNAPVITGGTHANGTFNNPTFSGTITGISAFPITIVASRAVSGTVSPGSWVNVLSITLTAGTWLLFANVNGTTNQSVTDDFVGYNMRVVDTGINVLARANGARAFARVSGGSASSTSTLGVNFVRVSSGETLTMQVFAFGNGQATINGNDFNPGATVISAIRIA